MAGKTETDIEIPSRFAFPHPHPATEEEGCSKLMLDVRCHGRVRPVFLPPKRLNCIFSRVAVTSLSAQLSVAAPIALSCESDICHASM